jgi:hypothetical protein
MVRTQVQIYSEQLKWLKHHALGKGVSMAQLIRESIDLYRSQIENSRMLHHQKKKALTAVGSFASKPNPID